MKNKLKVTLLVFMSLAVLPLSAQNGREKLRQQVQNWEAGRIVAITEHGGDCAIYGANGYYADGCPVSMTNQLKELNAQTAEVVDIALTENNNYIILYGNNGIYWNNIPEDMEYWIREFNREEEKFVAVALTADDQWVLVTEKHVIASDDDLQEWLAEGCGVRVAGGEQQRDIGRWSDVENLLLPEEAGNDVRALGSLRGVCLTEIGCVALYANGYRVRGELPEDLIDALMSTRCTIEHVSIAGTAWFISDHSGECYHYNM